MKLDQRKKKFQILMKKKASCMSRLKVCREEKHTAEDQRNERVTHSLLEKFQEIAKIYKEEKEVFVNARRDLVEAKSQLC